MLITACRKYRYMEQSLTQRKASLEEKIPDIRKTFSMVEFLQGRKVYEAAFQTLRRTI